MHETSLAGLPHVYSAQEDHSEGTLTPCFPTESISCPVCMLHVDLTIQLLISMCICFAFCSVLQMCVLLLQFVEAIVVLIRQTSHMRVTRALRPIFLVDCRYCGAVRRWMIILIKLYFWLTYKFICLFIVNYLLKKHFIHPIRNLRQIFQSLPSFIDILLLLLFFMVIFAILGKNWFCIKSHKSCCFLFINWRK